MIEDENRCRVSSENCLVLLIILKDYFSTGSAIYWAGSYRVNFSFTERRHEEQEASGSAVTIILFMKQKDKHLVSIIMPLFNAGGFMEASKVNSVYAAVYEGHHDVADCEMVGGWVWDVNQPDVRIGVDIYADNMLVATVAADEFRQDLADAGRGDGCHAFSHPVPPRLRDGKPHSIAVKVTGSDFPLTSTPRVINCEIRMLPDVKNLKARSVDVAADNALSILSEKIKQAYFRILFRLKADYNKVTVILPYCKTDDADREMNLDITLRYLSKIEIPNVIISEHSDISAKDFLISGYGKLFQWFRVFHTDAKGGLFNKAKAANVGVSEATTPYIALFDSDCLTKKRNINIALAMLDKGCDVVHPFNRRVTDIVEKERFVKEYDFDIVRSPEQIRPWADGGIVFWNKRSFVSIGMKNEYFGGWGGEDNEIMVRADLCQLKQYRIEDTLYHLYHYRPQKRTQNNVDQLEKTEKMKNKDECLTEVNSWPWVIEARKRSSC